MPRVCGIDIPGHKRVEIALTYIFGVGRSTARRVLTQLEIAHTLKASEVPEDQLSRIASHIEKTCMIEGQLKRQISQNINRLRDIKCYRGSRHRLGLPVRGQRTRHNARTRKGPRRTVAGKKPVKAGK